MKDKYKVKHILSSELIEKLKMGLPGDSKSQMKDVEEEDDFDFDYDDDFDDLWIVLISGDTHIFCSE